MTPLQAVAAARSYCGSPYVLGQHAKGAGVDCATLLGLYLIDLGAADAQIWQDAGLYSHDWFLHTARQRYTDVLKRYAELVWEGVCRRDSPAHPGQIVTFKAVGSGRFNHGAIVTSWPFGIHACHDGVKESNLANHRLTAFKPMDVFDPFQGGAR
jgi:cell wall-associated NlpC family hydrolase